MKIISRFKDYYDHQAHIYGVDDLQVYPRGEIHEGDWSFTHESRIDILTDDMRSVFYIDDINVNLLVVAGRAFPIAGSSIYRDYHLITMEHPEVIKEVAQYQKSPWGGRSLPACVKALEAFTHSQPENPKLLELCREVGHPVFMLLNVDHRHRRPVIRYTIDCKLPLLSRITGMAGAYPAQQIYQDLSAYFAHIEPVITPPSDLEKVTQHGFDKRVSFRHRS